MKTIFIAMIVALGLVACAPDLTVDSVSIPPSACPGDDIGPSSSLSVLNAGFGSVGADEIVHVAWYLSGDASWDVADLLMVGGRDQISSIAAGEIKPVSIDSNVVPASAAFGPQFMLTVVDEFDSVSETNESNNVAATPIEIKCGSGQCTTPDEEALIDENFAVCTGTATVGQTAPAGGVTCEEVCCVKGFAGCEYRAAQADYNACVPPDPAMTGSCSDIFADNWSSQCVCKQCEGNVQQIRAAFEDCGGTGYVGQSAPAGGVTCEQVCCAMGFSSCIGRAAQADFDSCNPPSAPLTGTCEDVFEDDWSSQCLCE